MEAGNLYLGKRLDAEDGSSAERFEVPKHHLTTHGVIVGMTGSGKTGLGVVLLEEILSSGTPTLILDPKGDMGNLLLNFPQLRAADFLPWVNQGDAGREGLSKGDYAHKIAERWKSGLEGSGIDGARMAALESSVEMKIYTPGSSAGIGLNILGDMSAPGESWDENAETIREEIEALVSGLLILAGIESDPLTSREHILLSNLIEASWKEGRGLDLPSLLAQVQNPPIRRLGIFEMDAFFPPNDRLKLAMRLNGLVASPSFAEWLHGEPLDIEKLLWAPDGRPKASIVYLAHLTETERQFVVTLILSKVVTWMRRQPGTSDLRAAIYIDELFGLAPPTAEPPSKRPILTLFKQARAHGVGMICATQNPVDVDYKVMSNAGMWMVGRLQTERDKLRVIEALRSASGDVDVSEWSERIGVLGKREFLFKSTRAAVPQLFTTRWAMSYLRGPLTRLELSQLQGEAEPTSSARDQPRQRPTDPPAREAVRELGQDESPVPPPVAKGIRVAYLDSAAPWASEVGVGRGGTRLVPGLALRVNLLFDETKADIRHEESWEAVLYPMSADPRLAELQTVDHDERDFRSEAPEDVVYVFPDAPIGSSAFFTDLKRDLRDSLYQKRSLDLHRNRELKLYSRVGEEEQEFAARCLAKAEDLADGEAGKLRDKFERRLDTARRAVAAAERRVRELDVDVGARQRQEMVAGAGEVLSMFLGGRRRVRSLSGASSRRGQTQRTKERLRSAEDKLAEKQETIEDLEDDLTEELADIWAEWQTKAEAIEPLVVGLEKTDIRVEDVTLFWAPDPH